MQISTIFFMYAVRNCDPSKSGSCWRRPLPAPRAASHEAPTPSFRRHSPRDSQLNRIMSQKMTHSPSSGEKPPLRINSRSHNCLSVRTIAGSVSASASSSFLRGASRAMRSFRTPPMSCQVFSLLFCYWRRYTMWWVCHCACGRT
jgi:hypothetical protein